MNITKLEQQLDGQLIMLTKFGSDLYGTSTPESDTDYKGIYLPSARELCLGNIPKSVRLDTNPGNEKNSNEDVDIEIYSLHYFLKLAAKGETVALDMLHTNKECLVYTSSNWVIIQSCRQLFYTKNLKAFVGYARKQAAKYGVKGSRLDAAKRVLDFLAAQPPKSRLIDCWDNLPAGEHIDKIRDGAMPSLRLYQICGKRLQAAARIDYCMEIVQRFYDRYGARAKLASENKGVDWKAMSHAIRAAVQVREILRNNNIVFPLQCADFLREVKQGKHEFEYVLNKLETYMEDVERLTEISKLREKVDIKLWDDFLVEVVRIYLKKSWSNIQKGR